MFAGQVHANELVIEIGFDGCLERGGFGGSGRILDEGIISGKVGLEGEQAEFHGDPGFFLSGEREKQEQGRNGGKKIRHG